MRFSATWLLFGVLCLGCGGPAPLTVDMPLHLEEHLDAATIVGSEVPADPSTVMEWRFDEPQEDWKPIVPWNRTIQPAQVTQLDDALRVTLTEGTRNPNGVRQGFSWRFPVGAARTGLISWCAPERPRRWTYSFSGSTGAKARGRRPTMRGRMAIQAMRHT